MGDPFDLARLRIDPTAIKPARPRKWQRLYVQIPWLWVERLQSAKRISTYRLAHLVLYENWKLGGRPIVLSNLLSAEIGLPRRTKWAALRELEKLGLVRVERCARKAPRVMLCHLPREET